MKKLRTHEEARAWLGYLGISVSQWARDNQMNQSLVYEILAGRKKCLRGMSHNIAVLLGMKAGVMTDRPGRVTPGAPERRDTDRRDHERRAGASA